MSTGAVAALSLILLLALIFFGVHLSTSLMFTSVLSVFLFTGRFSTAMNVLSQSAWGAVRQYMFGVIPLFVLMGLLANLSGASQDLYDSASLLLKKVRGGVGIATVIANAIFAAITGVTVASAAVFTKIALPQMLRLKYNRKIALGTISGSSESSDDCLRLAGGRIDRQVVCGGGYAGYSDDDRIHHRHFDGRTY